MKPILIGLHGPTGVGKDTICDIIRQISPLEAGRLAFGDALKAAVKHAFGLSDRWLLDEMKTAVHPFWNLTPREMFQLTGTEAFRHAFGENFWVRRVQMSMETASPLLGMFVVTDVRYASEAKWVREHGTLIHVSGPQRRSDVGHGHSSNAPLPVEEGDKRIANTGSMEVLTEYVRAILFGITAEAQNA